MTLNRREWLKLAAGAGFAVAELGADPQELQAATVESKLAGTKQVTTICNFCSCGCGMVCHVKDGKLVNLEGDPDHIVNQGALCSKGAAMRATHDSDQRVTAPLYRAPGSDHWQEISWEQAYDKLAKKIKQVRDSTWVEKDTVKGKDGKPVEYAANRTEGIGIIGGAQNSNEECYLLTKMGRLLGTVYVEHQARL